MQAITRHIHPYRNFKLFKLLRRTYSSSIKITKINCDKNLKVWFPIATKLLNQRISVLVSNRTTSNIPEIQLVDSIKFEKVCEETLESLTEYFEELVENETHLKSADINYSDGVLTVNFGDPYGTYVINRQSPNKQIWLSSPVSGPKRYDFVSDGEYWLYKHDGKTLHQLLQTEISNIVTNKVDFAKCLHSRIN
ncbi:frataxin [Holotrichia oblita]|uniref:Frataxin n=2 Tax=Holotrichia oblita TaxID=644536 RepID=A0ACB9SSR1_HOLOL|nr:frataxin [Holotrichia oblita]KAI4457535.1 frataxin [Holotrichia oblita]